MDDCGLDADKTDDAGATPLHFATAAGDGATAEWLLGAKANPAAANSDGNTPLHYAAQSGLLELATALLAQVGAVAGRGACS